MTSEVGVQLKYFRRHRVINSTSPFYRLGSAGDTHLQMRGVVKMGRNHVSAPKLKIPGFSFPFAPSFPYICTCVFLWLCWTQCIFPLAAHRFVKHSLTFLCKYLRAKKSEVIQWRALFRWQCNIRIVVWSYTEQRQKQVIVDYPKYT